MGPGLRREDANHYVSKMNEDSILYAPIERVPAPIFVTLPDGKRLQFTGPVTVRSASMVGRVTSPP